MERLQAFKYELRPNKAQKDLLAEIGGNCRYVYNQALALQIEQYEQGQKYLSYFDLAKKLTQWRCAPDKPWIDKAPVSAQRQKLKDLDNAYKKFFSKKSRFPKFKKKTYGNDSFRFSDSKEFKIDQLKGKIKLPKLGWINFDNHRPIEGTPTSVTVSSKAGRWFIAVSAKQQVQEPIKQTDSAIGIDLGIANLIALSDGSFVKPLDLNKQNKKLKYLQRCLSRKKKGSKNSKKQKLKIQKAHYKISNIKKDYLHKTTTTLSKSHAVVVMEDLKIKNMSRSAKGTIEKPGKNVKAKSGLNRSILAQNWGEIKRQLEYKQSWSGGRLEVIDPKNTSRTCPNCGYIDKQNRKTQANFTCLNCAFIAHADTVGAINVLQRAGLARLACGEKSSGVENIQRETDLIEAGTLHKIPGELVSAPRV